MRGGRIAHYKGRNQTATYLAIMPLCGLHLPARPCGHIVPDNRQPDRGDPTRELRDPGVQDPMKVAHLISPASVGGAESVVRIIANGRHRSLGHTQVIALVKQYDRHGWVESVRGDGVPVTEILAGNRRYVSEAQKVAQVLTDSKVDLLHTHIYHADFVGYLAAKRSGVPVIATYHGHTGGTLKNRFYEWFDRRLLKRFDGVVCVSQRNRNRLTRIGATAAKLHDIPNGMAPVLTLSRDRARAELGLPAEGTVIGWVGRISPEKGLDLLLKALSASGTHGTIMVIGDGPDRQTMETMADSCLPGRVRFAGERTNVSSLFSAFDVLVSSSRTEGSPMVLLEAMSAGTPIVAFGVGGIPHLLGDEAGWVVPPGNTRQLGESIRQSLADPTEIARRIERARDVVVRDYGVARWLERMEAVYTLNGGSS